MFYVSALHSAEEFSNEQQISEFTLALAVVLLFQNVFPSMAAGRAGRNGLLLCAGAGARCRLLLLTVRWINRVMMTVMNGLLLLLVLLAAVIGLEFVVVVVMVNVIPFNYPVMRDLEVSNTEGLI